MLARKNGLAAENCHFMDGSPTFHEICKLARQIGADLIVMPTHGYTGITRFFGGSTAERIVQHSPCPVLVARDGGKKSRRTSGSGKTSVDHILVPVDFSQPSFQALEYAIEFAERMASRLMIFHAVPLGDAFTADGFAMYDLSALEEAAHRDAEDQMQKFVGARQVPPGSIRDRGHGGVRGFGDLRLRRGKRRRFDRHCDPRSHWLQASAHGQHRRTGGALCQPACARGTDASGDSNCRPNEISFAQSAAKGRANGRETIAGHERNPDQTRP